MSQVLLAKLIEDLVVRVLLNFGVTFSLSKQSRDLVQRLIGKLDNYSRSSQIDFSSTALGKLDMSPHTYIFSPKGHIFLKALCAALPLASYN